MTSIGWPELIFLGGLLCITIFILLIVLIIWLARRGKQQPEQPAPPDSDNVSS